jgi:hypothetical protein
VHSFLVDFASHSVGFCCFLSCAGLKVQQGPHTIVAEHVNESCSRALSCRVHVPTGGMVKIHVLPCFHMGYVLGFATMLQLLLEASPAYA